MSLETGTTAAKTDAPPEQRVSGPRSTDIWRKSLWIWFILIGLLLLVNAILSQIVYRELNQQRELYQRNRHVQNDFASYLSTLKDMEIGQRGYLITGERSYLALFKDSSNQIKSLKVNIDKNLDQDSTQRQMLAGVFQQTDQKMQEMTRSIPKLDRSSDVQSEFVLENDPGKVLMDSLRDSIGQIIQHQEGVLTMIGDRSRNIRRVSSWLSFTTSVCGIIFLGLLYLYTQRTLRQRAALLDEQQLSSAQVSQALAEKERAFDDLTKANKVKDEFIAIVSHELRTPLNAILGWATLLKEGVSSEENAEGLQAIERNARSQSLLIEDLLDVSRVVAGKIRLQTGKVDLRKIARAVSESARPAVEAKEIELKLHLAEDAPFIMGDADRIQQIAWNLLSNAIKFTGKNGQIIFTVEQIGSNLAMIVQDNGQGIAQEFLPRIFNHFSQADTSPTRGQAGLGLGLAIVKHIAELHGGRVEAKSAGIGLGSSFKVEFPVATSNTPASETAAVEGPANNPANEQTTAMPVPNKLPDLTDLSIFLVDDEPTILSMLRDILTRCGATVHTAANAADALAALPEINPDILVSDIGLPDMDGHALMGKIRASAHADLQHVPALALTAFARNQDHMNSLEAGFNDHLAKPADPVEFARRVARLAGRS